MEQPGTGRTDATARSRNKDGLALKVQMPGMDHTITLFLVGGMPERAAKL